VYYHPFIVMQFVCGLLCSTLSHCYLLSVFCSLLCSNYSFDVFFYFSFCLFSCFVCFAFYFVCIVVCTVSSHVYSCLFLFVYQFTVDCHREETQLQLINIISYHIYQSARCNVPEYLNLPRKVTFHCVPPCY
jgi:hypothetical protein